MSNWLQKIKKLLGNADAVAQANMYADIEKYGARDVSKFDLTQPTRPLSATEIRGLATGGITFFWNYFPIKALLPLEAECLVLEKESLTRWWGISNTAEALERLERLLHTGHRQELSQQLRQQPDAWRDVFDANLFLHGRPVVGIEAWDYGRLVNVARWCYDFGYLNWEQAWPYIDAATRLALRDFYSWESFASSFLAGRLMWNKNSESNLEIAQLTAFLVESKSSPWRSIAWQPYPVNYVPGPA